MRLRALLPSALALTCLVAGGCSFKLASMAHDQGKASFGCEDAKYKIRTISAEERRIVVFGCEKFEVYEGSCNGENNGCDHGSFSDGCDGSCRVKRTATGALNEDGSVPEWALKGEMPPEQ